MARDPRSRHELNRRLEETLGPEAAETLMEAQPPHPWNELATKADLFEGLNGLEARMDLKLEAMEHRVIAAFRGELVTAVAGQSRMMWYSSLGSVIATGSLVLAASRL
jgi:hypothetical protein